MQNRGTLTNCDEAMQFIDRVEDPITKNLLNKAFVNFIKSTHLEKQQSPCGDFDMLYFVTVLKAFFSEHQVLSETLSGEKVGVWFGDEN